MRYYSADYNCCIDLGDVEDVSDAVDPLVRASITVRHPCLIHTRLDSRNDEIVMRSKISAKDICSFARSQVEQDECGGIDYAQLREIQVSLLGDVCPESSLTRKPSNAFNLLLPADERDDLDTPTSSILHADIETALMDIITHRKRQDDAHCREFARKQQEAFAIFEAEVNTQASMLSRVVLRGNTSGGTKSDRKSSSEGSDRMSGKTSRRMSSNSSHSASSATSSERPRKKEHKTKKQRVPTRSATTPVPKSVMSPQGRKSSLSESSKRDGSSDITPAKRVMFSELEPTRIDSPHVLDPSDTEDDLTTKADGDDEDVFDMDEQIPIRPIASTAPTSADVSVDGTVEIAGVTTQRAPVGREDSDAPSGSFKLRSTEKYDIPSPASSAQSPVDITKREVSAINMSGFATSLPRNIARPSPGPTPAPLSSMKDMPYLSPLSTDLNLDLDPLDNSPPQGMSRKMMWKQAVASSLRMSGLLMPDMSVEGEDKGPLRTSTLPSRQGLRGC